MLPAVIVMAASTQSTVPSSAHKGTSATTKTRNRAMKAAALTAVAMNSVTGVGAP